MNNNDKSYITLSDLWELFLANIWLFIISIILCVSCAVAYVTVTSPSYSCEASVLINDESMGGVAGSEALANLGLGSTKSYANNEIHVFTTVSLMEEVVARLSLDHIYKVKFKGLRWIDLYRNAPFTVTLDEKLENNTMNFNIVLDGKGGVEITDLVVDGQEIGKSPITAQLGQPVETSYGSFVVNYNYTIGIGEDEELDESYFGTLYSFTKADPSALAQSYSSALSADFRSDKASIIVLKITMGSKAKAEDLLNTLINVYSENWVKDKNAITLSTLDFIDERLRIIEEELGIVDKEISDYKSSNLLPDLGAVAGMNLASSNEIFQRQVALSNQLSMAKYIFDYIKDESTKDKLLPVNAGIESASINSQIERYNELLMERNTLLANSSLSNPIIADMSANLESMRELLALSVGDLIETLNLQVANARREEKVNQKKISNNPSQELFLLSTGREQSVKEQLYLYLLQKREGTQLDQAFSAYNTRVLNWARGSSAPVAPQRNVKLLFGFAIGVILPIIFLILKASMNTTIGSKYDLSGVSIPFLGSIPLVRDASKGLVSKIIKSRSAKPEKLLLIDSSRSQVSEAFRVVRTNLDFMLDREKKCKMINVTSFNPGSGKSFIILNMGLSMAMKESRTLIVDCDFRRGTLSKAVEKSPFGIVNYLNGSKKNIDDLITQGTHHTHLDVLPMGIMPPNPTELLLTDNFAKLLEELQERYEYIFFDCPPLDVVPDASIVEKFCDSTIFVARAGLFDKRLVPDLEELYTSKRIKGLSLIINGVEQKGKYGSYGRYGYGGYGYGYGYGSK